MAEAKKASKAKTTKTKAEKPANIEEPVTPEKDVTEAAVEAAQEEQTIINEKRETAGESVLPADPETVESATLTETDDQALAAKAGKRSTKAQREAAAETERQVRKESGETAESKPKAHSKPTRSRRERQGKGIRKSAEKIEQSKAYTLEEAVALAKDTSHVKFDATVELHVNLSVDPRHADQNVRDNLVLPAGTGKQVRVAVLTDDAAEAKKAGADTAGNDDFLQQLEKGKIDFDTLIATPALMPKLGKYARVLGPRGLMPNPKSGTVTTDVNRAVAEAKAGRVEYRVDSTGIIHLGVGKVSFTPTQLLENVQAVLASIKANKPSSVKGTYFKSAHLATTMGPSITLDLANIG